MSASHSAILGYHAQAAELAERYDNPALLAVHADLTPFLPERAEGKLALDIGAGSGRDAGWLAGLGYQVVAVEPADALRLEGQHRYSDGVRWLNDRLPALNRVHALAMGFDLIVLSAVWQHVAPGDRARAFRKLATLMKPGAVMTISLRTGPAPLDRPMYEVSAGEVETLARLNGLEIARVADRADAQSREDVRWTTMILRSPDDGSGALPLIRGIILADNKSATYKLALLRAVSRVAEHAAATAIPVEDGSDAVAVPLGLVALFWLRMYLPLVRAGLPQMPNNRGPDGLSFAKAGFRALAAAPIAPPELRVGAGFIGEAAAALTSALSEAAATITTMPATYTRYPGSDRQVFASMRGRAPRGRDALTLDVAMLRSWGNFTVPGPVWRTLTRLGAWIEPVLVQEWARLMRGYGERMGIEIPIGQAEAHLTWEEPTRDTTLGRLAVERIHRGGASVDCVWSGKLVTANSLDIDHCLPWSAWPCGDLWNLMPADRRVNQHQKRDRLPSQDMLSSARPRIVSWWASAWQSNEVLGARFIREAAAALPIDPEATLDGIFDGLEWRRMRLRQDQQVPEWAIT